MKPLNKLSMAVICLMALISCSTDPTVEPQVVQVPQKPDDGDVKSGSDTIHVFFGFLDGDGSSQFFIDIPIDSSSEDLLVGRWEVTKVGVDENNDGNIVFKNYADFDHKECGSSFLQFNSNGVVYENSYYNSNGSCTLYSEIDEWEYIGANRLQIYVYNNIYVVNVTEEELVLKYDWAFENSLYGPMQVYYHYQRLSSPM